MIVKIWLIQDKQQQPPDIIYSLPEALEAYERTKSNLTGTLNTTCTKLCNMHVLEEFNRLILVYPSQEVELKLGEACISGRMIRPGLNLEKLLNAGEFDPINVSVCVCHILQIPDGETGRDRRFTGTEEREKRGEPYPHISEYDHVFDYNMRGTESLEEIYRMFQFEGSFRRPADYAGRSLSVSDVMIVNDMDGFGKIAVYFIDSRGFTRLDRRFFMKAPESKEV